MYVEKEEKRLKKALMKRLNEEVKRQDKMYLDYLKQIKNPEKYKSYGILPMIHHDHRFFATHTLDETNTLIWQCSCGMKTKSM